MSELSDSEIRVISAIEMFWEQHQKGATYEELAEIVGLSTSTLWRRVQKLIDQGIVMVDEGKHRSISLATTSYTTWEVVMNNGDTLIIACETEERARELVKARYAPNLLRFFVQKVTKSTQKLAEIERKTGGKFELIARVDTSL